MLGYYPVKVLPSKTAIAPVNPTFLPRVRNCVYFPYFLSEIAVEGDEWIPLCC
uniref:RNA-binding protein n=1 Tax=Solanum tuberosum TaxID=4113 RepID=M0ZUE6_SOLTU